MIDEQDLGDVLTSIGEWHAVACPEPDDAAFNVQLGVHLEELAEMIECLVFSSSEFDGRTLLGRHTGLYGALVRLSNLLKRNVVTAQVEPRNRQDMLDALGDQIVTSVGVGYRLGMNVPAACLAVDKSNWSKFVDGVPLRDANGKIIKGPDYKPPVLDGMF